MYQIWDQGSLNKHKTSCLHCRRQKFPWLLHMFGDFSCFSCCLLTFFKIYFFKSFYKEHYQSVNGLDPDQDCGSVSADLGPKHLQR